MTFLRSEGIVINKFNYGEADRRLTIFLEDYGKVSSLIKGINKSKKRDKTAVDLLSISEFYFYKKNDNIIVTNFETNINLSALKNNLDLLNAAYYFILIVNNILVENGRDINLYKLLKNSILYLNKLAINENNENHGLINKKSYVLILYFLYNITILEGINNFDEIKEFKEENTNEDKTYKLNKLEREIFMKLEAKDVKSIIANDNYGIEKIIKLIRFFEAYINELLEIEISTKGLIFGGTLC